MAVQNPFFGRRDSSSNNNSSAPGNQPASSDGPSTRQATGVLGSAASRSAASAGGALPASLAATAAASGASAASASGGSKLTVGPNIKLKGVEITDCDTLVVEGTVEATMDSRVIHIAEQGAFRGSAEIDIAEIHGQFDGQLTVRDKLVIFGSGKVSGKIRYGKVVIEEGGQLSGEIEGGLGAARLSPSSAGSASHAAAAAGGGAAAGQSAALALA
ncbi:hypothetical protein GCM10027019_14910 [Melaminivora jejuensis]|uniref:bactofilin family protein n=1 Tax=Melaminivora jejuensis TaxID=1267217 RepID=UPI001AE07576|nr:polymer-forming cytoskeletal protein [Melaminivora jejuensis]UHJ64475.1 polymer-forming cytoskeletal protein [Melaminivora jejuensis]